MNSHDNVANFDLTLTFFRLSSDGGPPFGGLVLPQVSEGRLASFFDPPKLSANRLAQKGISIIAWSPLDYPDTDDPSQYSVKHHKRRAALPRSRIFMLPEGEVAHESIVDVLRTLPTPHRNFLFEKFHARMPDTNRIEPRLERLAELLGSRGIQQYRDLYQNKGGLLSWYVFPETKTTTRKVEVALREDYPGIEEGLTPELEWDADPVPYSMRRRADVLILKLAALNGEREYYSNWRHKTIRFDVTYIIVLRDDPFTIEVRSAYGKVKELYRTVSAEIRLRLDDGEECKLHSKKLRKELKKSLDARCFFAQHRHADVEIAKTAMEAQPAQDLEEGQRLKGVEAEPGVTGFSRWYDFKYQHPDDYVEHCIYKVNLSNGQVRVGKDMSEPAIKELQQHVVALYTR